MVQVVIVSEPILKRSTAPRRSASLQAFENRPGHDLGLCLRDSHQGDQVDQDPVPRLSLQIVVPSPLRRFGAGDGDALTAFLVHSPFRPKSKTPPTHWIDGVNSGCGGRICSRSYRARVEENRLKLVAGARYIPFHNSPKMVVNF